MKQEIKERLELIKSTEQYKDKLLKTKELIVNTDILIQENVLACFDFDNDVWYHEENYFKKFLEYKKISDGVYGNVDCDVSLLCVVMYVLLNDNLCLKDIVNQCNSERKFKIRRNDAIYKGDTLTSALKSMKLYLGCLWEDINTNEKLKNEKKYYDFHKRFASVRYRVPIPIEPTKNWNEYCYRNSEIIWEVMDDSAKNFLKSIFKFGNFICIPGKSYPVTKKFSTSFNMARSCAGNWDTVDTLLWKMYLYFTKKNTKYLFSVFAAKEEIKKEIVKETELFLKDMGMTEWEQFIEKNCLDDFICEQSRVPISMKTGKEISLDEEEGYSAMPKTIDEFEEYFKQISNRIDERGKKMLKKIRDIK